MSERILLVDDEDFVLRALRGHLAARVESGELAVATAVDGPDAVEKARKSVADGNPFDLAVIDFQMTDEMNGLETLGHVRKHLPDICGIMLTGHAQQSTPVEALNLGFRYYLVKPVTREAFLAALDEQVRQVRLAKRNRSLQAALARFHGAVQQILATIQTVAKLTEPVEFAAAAADVVEAAIQTARAADGFLLLAPASGDGYLVHDRRGKPVDVVVPVGRGTIGMAAGAGSPVIRAAEAGRTLTGADVGPLEQGRRAVIAVPIVCGSRAAGTLLLADPAAPESFPQYERALALIGRLAGIVLEAARAEGRRQSLLLGALRAGLAAAPGSAAGQVLLDQLNTSISSLESGLKSAADAAAADPALDGETRTAMEMAACIREIARYGPEGIEFCRSMLDQFRSVMRTYCE